jgi:hypothetical protein
VISVKLFLGPLASSQLHLRDDQNMAINEIRARKIMFYQFSEG